MKYIDIIWANKHEPVEPSFYVNHSVNEQSGKTLENLADPSIADLFRCAHREVVATSIR